MLHDPDRSVSRASRGSGFRSSGVVLGSEAVGGISGSVGVVMTSVGVLVGSVGVAACIPPSKRPSYSLARPDGSPVFAVLPAESLEFPRAAHTTTDRMRRARIRGYGPPEMSKVSLEVVQLSIECVEPSVGCYARAGKALEASQLLFARIEPGPARDEVKITVTLFDVARQRNARAAAKIFATEDDVPYGIADVIAEVTRP